MPRWRNWQTRTFEGRMEQSMWVRFPLSAVLSGRIVQRQNASLTPRKSQVQILFRPDFLSGYEFIHGVVV